MTEHYLDNSATTKVCDSAIQKAAGLMADIYGNPSSLHTKGIQAEAELELARAQIAKHLHAQPKEIIFTSGGTEANNIALQGAAGAKKRLGNKIVTTAVEHSSVLEAAEHLQAQGYEVVFLQPDTQGNITPEQLEQAIDGNTILVSVMTANNETGSLFPVGRIAKIIKQKKAPALLHTDAVQAFGKLELKPEKLGIDLLTVSAHKVHGPKGVGALYVKKGVRILPVYFGGGQENSIRPGTQPMPLIGAFGQAVSEFDITANYDYIKELHQYAAEKLLSLEGVTQNSPDNGLPYILNLSVRGIKSETMLHHLAAQSVYVSSGSACSKGKKSYVLNAMGLAPERIDSALRISFSKYNTKADVDALYRGIASGISSLVRK